MNALLSLLYDPDDEGKSQWLVGGGGELAVQRRQHGAGDTKDG